MFLYCGMDIVCFFYKEMIFKLWLVWYIISWVGLEVEMLVIVWDVIMVDWFDLFW